MRNDRAIGKSCFLRSRPPRHGNPQKPNLLSKEVTRKARVPSLEARHKATQDPQHRLVTRASPVQRRPTRRAASTMRGPSGLPSASAPTSQWPSWLGSVPGEVSGDIRRHCCLAPCASRGSDADAAQGERGGAPLRWRASRPSRHSGSRPWTWGARWLGRRLLASGVLVG